MGSRHTVTTGYGQISRLLKQARELDIIKYGLDLPYSPNHKGQTTREHLEKQLDMADALSRVASQMWGDTTADETTRDLEAIEALLDRDYAHIHEMISNENVKDKLFLYTTKTDIREFFEPLIEGLSMSDIRVLIAVAAMHDIGKVDQEWAKGRIDLSGVEFIAHDYDSRTLLENNPELLSMFELGRGETALTLDLVKLHSLPGQYFFGEGNLAGYQPVFDYARAMGSESPMKLARIHGLVDVMSALNHGFVKPILASHVKMSGLITEVYQGNGTLGQAFQREAEAATTGLGDVMDDLGLAPNAVYRLMKLTDTKADEKETISRALFNTYRDDPAFIKEFNRATAGEATWYGTYIANAFGSGFKRASGKGYEDMKAEAAIEMTVKAVAAASDFHSRFGDSSYALSSVKPSLMVNDGMTDEIGSKIMRFRLLDNMSESLCTATTGLYIRGNGNSVEIGYRNE